MTRSFKRVFIAVRNFALEIDTGTAMRHGAPVPKHARNQHAPAESVAGHS